MDFHSLTQHFLGQWHAFWRAIVTPGWGNFFWLLVAVSAIVFLLEVMLPWRKRQRVRRPELCLDLFYMFFNMFLFPLLGYATLSHYCASQLETWRFIQALRGLIPLQDLPAWLQIVLLFVARDFIQWNVHVILHRVPFFWKLHEVHHSAEIMSFPVHLRYHWAENIIYAIPEYFLFLMLSRSVNDLFIIYALSLFIGHLNHANLRLPWGALKYVLNTSELHLWHHAKRLPGRYGVNYALSLSLWDWLFRTAYDPRKPPAEIGLADEPGFPRSFLRQLVWPLGKK
jgi:sterol desaturase/sphingolipid hydroxylase (fatty acid hydroxylase superfamily)